MKWIKHDTNANQDAKLKRMRMKYGLEGYGMYWYCLELIAADVDQNKLTFELEHDAEIISFDTGIHCERVNEMVAYMVNLGLFEENNGILSCLKLAKRLDKSMTSNPVMRKMLGDIRLSHDNVMTESEKPMQDKIRLDETREDNTIKTCATVWPVIDQIQVSFDQFWFSGMKKVNKKKALSAYKSQLKANKKHLHIIDSELHFAQHLIKDVKKRLELNQLGFSEMHPTTYLNGERWNDDYPEKRTNSDFSGIESTSNWSDGLENEFHGVNEK